MLASSYNLYEMRILGEWLKQGAALIRHFGARPQEENGRSVTAVLRCDCGETLEEQREQYRKSVVCPRCGTALFLYPVSPYPEPEPPPEPEPREAPEAPEPAHDVAPAEPEVPEAEAAEPEPAGTATEAVEPSPIRRTPEDAAPVAPRPQLTEGRVLVSVPAPSRPWWRRRSTVIIGVAAAVLTTLVLLFWHGQRGRYRRSLVEHLRSGQKALREGRLQEAIAAFRRVDEALRWLGGSAQPSYVQQLTSEVLAASELIVLKPEELFAEYGQADWEQTFRTFYAGRTVLLEAGPVATDSPAPELPIPWYRDERRVVWRLDGPGPLRRLGSQASPRVVLLARLQSVDKTPAGTLLVTLDAETSVLVTSSDLLRCLGWPEDDQTEACLEAQRRLFQRSSRDRQGTAPAISRWSWGHFGRPRLLAAELVQRRPVRPFSGLVFAHELDERADWQGMTITVYGKYKARLGKHVVLLHECSVRFQLLGDTRLPAAPRWLYLEGTLYRRHGRLVVEVRRARRAPDPEELFREQAERIARTDASSWLQLAAWAEQMARRYRLERLGELADEARTAARRAEMAAVKQGDVEQVENLIRKYRDSLSPAELRYYTYLVLLWKAQQLEANEATAASTWRQLAEELFARLPAAKMPASEVPDGLVRQFRADPAQAYRQHKESRDLLDRLLARRVLGRYFEKRAAEVVTQRLADLSKEAETLLPDEPQVARSLFDRWLRHQWERAESLSRAEALETVKLIAERDKERASEFLRHWLRRREARLPEDDTLGRLRLAGDYQDRLGDRAEAARLLLEVVRRDPDNVEARRRLLELGYRYRRRTWFDPQGNPVRTLSDTRRPAPPAASPRIGQTAAEVRTVMGGPPNRIARLATANGIAEVWSYDAPKGTLVITFRIRGGRATVLSVHQR